MIPVFDGSKPPADMARELDSYVSKMSHMLGTDGWQMFERYLKSEEDRAFLDLQRAVTADMAMKSSAAYVMLKSVREYPLRSMESAVASLRELGKK